MVLSRNCEMISKPKSNTKKIDSFLDGVINIFIHSSDLLCGTTIYLPSLFFLVFCSGYMDVKGSKVTFINTCLLCSRIESRNDSETRIKNEKDRFIYRGSN